MDRPRKRNHIAQMARKVANDSSWQMNTNLEAAIGLMLRSYIADDLHPDEVKNMVLVIFSDMQIDKADSNAKSMNELIKKCFQTQENSHLIKHP